MVRLDHFVQCVVRKAHSLDSVHFESCFQFLADYSQSSVYSPSAQRSLYWLEYFSRSAQPGQLDVALPDAVVVAFADAVPLHDVVACTELSSYAAVAANADTWGRLDA